MIQKKYYIIFKKMITNLFESPIDSFLKNLLQFGPHRALLNELKSDTHRVRLLFSRQDIGNIGVNHWVAATCKVSDAEGDLPSLFVPPFTLEFGQYFPVNTITKKDQSVKGL